MKKGENRSLKTVEIEANPVEFYGNSGKIRRCGKDKGNDFVNKLFCEC